MRVIHLTSVHPWNDTRIYHKMCRSLAEAGHEVHIVAPRADVEPGASESHAGVTVHAVAVQVGRIRRMTRTVSDVLGTSLSLNGDIYHFHDPELLYRAIRLHKKVKRPFIYDVHEDYREGIYEKRWIPYGIRGLTARIAGWLEDYSVKHLAGIVVATPYIARHFLSHPACAVVQNYPITDTHLRDDGDIKKESGLFAYLGVVSRKRGIREMIAALPGAGPDITLAVAGDWEDAALVTDCNLMPGSGQTRILGHIQRPDAKALLRRAVAGVVLFHPAHNHDRSQPNKLFEYMSEGLPVIASDFPLWRDIIAGEHCGLLVNPLDPSAIASAMRWIVDHPEEAAAMGRRGMTAIFKKFNWATESRKLLDLYALLG